MSSSVQTTRTNVVNSFNGGQPARNDLIPGIIFSVALGLTIPLLLWRILSKKHRSKTLINALLFFVTRTAAMILRSYMSRHSYGDSALIAELVLTSISYLFLANSLIDLWQKAETRTHSNQQMLGAPNFDKMTTPNWVRYVAWFLRLLLLTALITAIAAGGILSRKLDNNDKVKVIEGLLKASYVLSLASTIFSIISVIVTHFIGARSMKSTIFMLSYSIPLLVVSIYKVVEVFTGKRATHSELIAFYVAMILFEFLAYLTLLSISIPKWFASNLHDHIHSGGSDEEKHLGRPSATTRRSADTPTETGSRL